MYTKYALVLLTLAISGARKAAPRLGMPPYNQKEHLDEIPASF